MADATGVIHGAPTHLIEGVASAAGASRAGRHGGDGSRRIKPVGDDRAVDRRRVVEEHPCGSLQAGCAAGLIRGGNAVADEALDGIGVGAGAQQTAAGILQHRTGFGIDGLEQPGGDARLGIHTSRHPQHEAQAAAVVEVALEHGLIGRQLQADLAEFQCPQAQATGVEIGIELADKADLPHPSRAGIAEGHLVRQRIAHRHEQAAISARQLLGSLHSDCGAIRGTGGAILLEVLGQIQGLGANRPELGVQQADVTEVFKLRSAAHEQIKADEMSVPLCVALIVGRIGGDGDRNFNGAVITYAHFQIINRSLGRLGIAAVTRRVAIPFLDLGEEINQIRLGLIEITRLADQNAAGQGGIEADHLASRPHGRGLIHRAQQASGLQRRQPALNPTLRISGQGRQGRVRVGISQNRLPQAQGVAALIGDEFSTGERRGRGQGVEAERHRQRFAGFDVLFIREKLGGKPWSDLVQGGHASSQKILGLPFGVDRIELGAQTLKITIDPLLQAGIGLHRKGEAHKLPGTHIKGIARNKIPALAIAAAVQTAPGNVRPNTGVGRGSIGLADG